MTSLVAPFVVEEDITLKDKYRCKLHPKLINNRNSRHSIKTKCNFKPICDKTLKRKLLKYKLRRNGEEDQDVVNVSNILLSSLKIKSPSKTSASDFDELKPKNYLFKMARRKQKFKSEKSDAVEENAKDCEGPCPSAVSESQEKKQTNAFHLMMNSRNKSIGGNSPGKEMNIDPSEIQENIQKKSMKVKRNLALLKMAEAKGSLKKKEVEEQQEMCIRVKMEKRKERLMNMIINKEHKEEKSLKKSKKPLKRKIEVVDGNTKLSNTEVNLNNNPSTLQLVDIFKDDDILSSSNSAPVRKIVSKEDKEFLNKLSPSLKKKENMLCYFKKLEKSPDNDNVLDISASVIKVKVAPKIKKKTRKKKLSLNKDTTTDILKDHNENDSCNNVAEKSNDATDNLIILKFGNGQDRNKRKHKENSTEPESRKPAELIDEKSEIARPKRNIKRPVKYVDDAQLFSSDEDLQIFTPKKRKSSVSKTNLQRIISDEVIICDDVSQKRVSKGKKITEKEDRQQKKPPKLAPIFAPKPQLNAEQIEAKHRFLYSGVPDQIKKINAHQKNSYTDMSTTFPVVVHVQQSEIADGTPIIPSLFVPDNDSDEDILTMDERYSFKNVVILSQIKETQNIITPLKVNTTAVLKNIKELYPKFPVYRTFRLLKNKSKGEFKELNSQDLENSIEVLNSLTEDTIENPDYLNWTDKYKATSSKNLFGNFKSIKELRKWLQSWTEDEIRRKKTNNESDSSDFYDSDSNSKDSIKAMNNLLILNGPIGSGKTSSVYAIAGELAIKVIEVNASSKRTGKMMLQELQEATQSHKVNRGGLDNSQKSQEVIENPTIKSFKKRGRPKKIVELKKTSSKEEMLSQTPTSQERTAMSLILVDDADIVFDQDDGFSSAIAQLAQCSKRPVILVTSSLKCPHLQRFLYCGKIIYMNPLPPKILGTWLDIMCLADNGVCWPGLGAKFLDYFKGDIRKTINSLQFYLTTNSRENLQEVEGVSQCSFKPSSEEESSNMSWADDEGYDENNVFNTNMKDNIWKCFMDKQTNLLHLRYPKDLFNVWWSLPSLLCEPHTDRSSKESSSHTKPCEQKRELDTLTNVIDTLSLSDYYSCKQPDKSYYIASNPWIMTEHDSVLEQERLDNHTGYYEITNDIIQELVTSSITGAQRTLKCERSTAVHFPGMAAQREKDRIVTRHDNLTSILNPSAILDRKALALDYWSSCRAICRVEQNKTDTVSKRNNRFCHYLKSLNAIGRNDSFDSLADSLCFKGKED